MFGRTTALIGFAAVAITGIAISAAPAQHAQAPAPPVKIGMVSTLFRDVPPSLVPMLTPPFQNLMRDQTGLEGDVITAGDADDLGRRLHEKQIQLGVFHGFEFAWAQQKYPDLKPLMIAINKQRSLKAFIIVRDDCPWKSLSDLKGQTISLPKRTREHCLLFLARELAGLQAEQKTFFAKTFNHGSIEDALDDILRDKVHAVLVDGVSLENYEQVKSGCFARLRVLRESEAFPPGVVAYREGAIDPATLQKFTKGMSTANQNARGRELMSYWKLTAFEPVPANFDQALSSILRSYPPPPVTAPAAHIKN